MKRQNGLLMVLGMGLIALAGCTKERPYEEILKDKVFDKPIIDEKAEYLYIPTVLESTRTSTASRPFWVGEAKIVKLHFTEDSLQVLEVEKDERFTDNVTNLKPVLNIPVVHVDYKCRENSVGECSHQEEENSKLLWNQKSRFKVVPGSVVVHEVNTLPIALENFLSMGSCHPQTGSRYTFFDLTADTINLQVDNTYSTALACADNNLDSLSDLTFSVLEQYSLVKLNKIASSDYKAVNYPEADQGKFGFFTTDLSELSEDNRARVSGDKTFLNRWNPNRSEVVYNLSPGFAKPENAAVKQATIKGIAAINDALAKAGAKLQIRLEQDASKMTGDIRNSTIVMVEDPVAAGLLGYGPTVANPRTGEILSGRVVMYLGTIKQTIRTTYEEIRKELDAKAAETKASQTSSEKTGGESAASVALSAALKDSLVRSAGKMAPIQLGDSGLSLNAAAVGAQDSTADLQNSDVFGSQRFDEKIALNMIKNYKANALAPSDLKEKADVLSRNCLYTADLFNFEDAVTKGIREVLKTDQLKPWEDLSESERKKILDILVPYVWVPTLVHEMGHNLGLRHNFQGSEDKDNYYSQEELAKMGIQGSIPYSSVMDYSARTINELPTMGKYDIAALRFGYARKVELKDGKSTEVSTTLKDLESSGAELKDFGFCTDEHVALNAGCKRFDEGASLKEIAQYEIKAYEDRYKWRNFRNNNRNFSLNNDSDYAQAIDSQFYNLRLVLEVYDRISARFTLTEKEWETIPFLKDLKEATELTSEFFKGVIAMPDVTCVAVSIKDQKAKPIIAPLSEIASDEISCFSPDLAARIKKAGYEIIGQGGKSFQSRKDKNNTNPYADQIDVRGIWIDKLLATKYLVARRLGVSSLDATTGNYLNLKNGATEAQKLFQSVLMNQISSKVAFTLNTGETVSVPMNYKLDLNTSQLITRQNKAMRKLLGLGDADTTLAKELVSIASRELPDIRHTADSGAFLDTISVFTKLPDDGRGSSKFKSLDIGTTRFLALAENTVATQTMSKIKEVRVLNKLTEEQLQKILDDLKKQTDDGKKKAVVSTEETAASKTEAKAKVSPEEKAARELGAQAIEDFLSGRTESEGYYSMILTDLLLKK